MTDTAQITELLRQGIAATKAGRKQEARHVLLQATKLDEQNEQGWLWLSEVVESLEDRRICLENVLAINPSNAHAQAGLRWLEQHTPISSLDQEHCPHCGSAVPPSGATCPHCRQPLIVVCPGCERYVDVNQSSCSDCRQFLGDFRQGVNYHVALAQAYADRQKLDLAQEAIERAEAEASDNLQMLERVAALYEAIGRVDSAIATYEQAIELTPDNGTLYARLGAIYRQRSASSKARAMYERAAELVGKDPTILLELAQLYAEKEESMGEAIKLLRQVIHLESGHVQAHLLLGDAYLSQKLRNQARKHYEKACQLTPSSSDIGREARRRLGLLQLSSGQQVIVGPVTPAYSRPRERPGCVTVYAVLMGVGTFLTALVAILMGIGMVVGHDLIEEMRVGAELTDWAVWTFIAIAFVISVLGLAVAIGLWNLKNWARITAIVLQVSGLLSNLFRVITAIGTINDFADKYGSHWLLTSLGCGLIAILGIQCYILFWFVANGDLFD